MPVLNINNLDFNSDIDAWDLPPNILSEIENVRYNNNGYNTFGGRNRFVIGDQQQLIHAHNYLRHLAVVTTDTQRKLLYIGKTIFEGRIRIELGNNGIIIHTFTNIDEISAYNWASDNFGKLKVLSNYNESPVYFDDNTNPKINQLPFNNTQTWSDKSWTAKVIRAHKNFLFALGINENGSEFPYKIRWSDVADTGSIPSTWDDTDPANRAGSNVLLDNSGVLIDALPLRDQLLIYTTHGITNVSFIGGQFTWGFRSLSKQAGLLSINCIAEVRGRHVVFGDGDIYLTDGNSINSIAHNRIIKQINNSMDTSKLHQAYVINHRIKKEVWFCFTEHGYEHPSIAFIWNWEDNKWSKRILDRIMFAVPSPYVQDILQWNNVSPNWDSISDRWAMGVASPIDDTIVGLHDIPVDSVNNNGGIRGEILDTDGYISAENFASVIERTNLQLSSADNVTMITSVYPHIDSPSACKFQIGSQQYSGGPISWKPEVTFNPNFDRKIDIRSTGAFHAWRITQEQPQFRFTGLEIEYVEAGKR